MEQGLGRVAEFAGICAGTTRGSGHASRPRNLTSTRHCLQQRRQPRSFHATMTFALPHRPTGRLTPYNRPPATESAGGRMPSARRWPRRATPANNDILPEFLPPCGPGGSLNLEELEHRSNFLIEAGSINLPPMQCSFPWKNHPECAKLKEMCDAWILYRFGDLYPSKNDPKVGYTFADGAKLVNSCYHLLATLTYPTGSSERMPPTVKFMAWFLMVDNLLDDPNAMGGDPEAAEELLDSVMAVLRNNTEHPRSPSRAINVMADTAHEWWSGFCRGMSPGQQARFVQAIADTLDAMRRQVQFRKSRCLPDLPTYARLRADTSCWRPCSVVIEYVNGVDLDDETATHPLVRKLQHAAAFHVHCLNDLLSFKKEYLEDDYLNIVPVLYYSRLATHLNAPKRLLQDVVDQVATMIQEKDEECGRLMKEICECETLTKKLGVEVYLEGVGSWLGGNRYWHLVSSRYGVGASGPAVVERPPATRLRVALQG